MFCARRQPTAPGGHRGGAQDALAPPNSPGRLSDDNQARWPGAGLHDIAPFHQNLLSSPFCSAAELPEVHLRLTHFLVLHLPVLARPIGLKVAGVQVPYPPLALHFFLAKKVADVEVPYPPLVLHFPLGRICGCAKETLILTVAGIVLPLLMGLHNPCQAAHQVKAAHEEV